MVSFQEQAAKMTRDAIEAVLRTATFVPEDRLDWCPMGLARTVRDQLAECITSAEGLAVMLTADFAQGNLGRAQFHDRRKQILEGCTDLKSLTDLARAKYSELCAVIQSTPDARLEQEFLLPFAPGKIFTGVDLLFMAYWNLVYHLGQINYIEMMLGDAEMH